MTSLNNIGAMFHPAPMVLNAGRIQSGQSFEYYREGITPAVASLVRGLDRERLAVARAWGVQAEPVESWLRQSYGLPRSLRTLESLVAANPAYAGVMAPTTLHHRYLLEDVPTGLVPLTELGRMAGVRTPLMHAVIDMACELVGVDLREHGGRTLAHLGWHGAGSEELREMVTAGLPEPREALLQAR
ncbi:MAG: NAD/NADP octopine/nopaline dehydrogenase family protein [Limnochordaceae bacterium]|nr:NAD/NADP octopine/nopaline dehydrogenase family protein [Limnochordaceae bacterium]